MGVFEQVILQEEWPLKGQAFLIRVFTVQLSIQVTVPSASTGIDYNKNLVKRPR